MRRTGYSRCHGGKVCCPDDKIALLKNPQPEDFARSGGEGRYGRIAARSPKKGQPKEVALHTFVTDNKYNENRTVRYNMQQLEAMLEHPFAELIIKNTLL